MGGRYGAPSLGTCHLEAPDYLPQALVHRGHYFDDAVEMIWHTDGLMQTYVMASLLFEGHYLLPFFHHSEAHLAQHYCGLVRVIIQLTQTGDAVAGHEGDEVYARGIVVVAFVVGR